MSKITTLIVTITVASATLRDRVAEEIASHGTIQPQKKRQSDRTIQMIVEERKAESLYAVLGYMKRQGWLTAVQTRPHQGGG